MPIDLYHMDLSQPCRAVRMVAKEIGVELNLKTVDLMQQEHLKPEFLKLNPQHTIPTLDDNGFHLWESRAIITYLASKYGTNDTLYPKDPQKRAVVDRLLYFDLGSFYKAFSEYYYPQMWVKLPADAEKLDKLKETLVLLEGFFTDEPYLTGAHLTVADFSIVGTVALLEAFDLDLSPYPKLKAWLARIKSEVSFFGEINDAGIETLKSFLPAK